MEQPKIYNSKEEWELIEWLKSDLERQKAEGIEEEELVLNIGFNDLITKVAIDFKFNFIYILKELGCDRKDEKENVICPYKLNCINVTFSGAADFSGATFSKNANFRSATFTQNADFSGATFSKNANFRSATFTQNADFSGATFTQNANFNNVTFGGEAYFFNATFSGLTNFWGTTFIGEANFWGTTFIGEANFNNVTFGGEAYFFNATFSGKTHFSMATFTGKAYFLGTVFLNTIHFNSTKIENIITFDNIVLNTNESHITFYHINYDDKTQKFTKIKNSKIEIINTAINGRIEFNNVAIEKIDFKGSDILGGGVLNRINFKAEPANSDTARILKHEAIKRSNTIEALKFKAIEVEEHEKELKIIQKENKHKIKELSENKKSNRVEIKKLKKENVKYCYDTISLFMSRLSNKHGQSWQRAIVFTLIAWVIPFTLFYLILILSDKNNFLNIGCFLTNLIEYFIPTNYNILSSYLKNDSYNTVLKFPAIFFYMIGKIFIPYGVFEIIQAFRKFNTKGN